MISSTMAHCRNIVSVLTNRRLLVISSLVACNRRRSITSLKTIVSNILSQYGSSRCQKDRVFFAHDADKGWYICLDYLELEMQKKYSTSHKFDGNEDRGYFRFHEQQLREDDEPAIHPASP